MPPTETSLVVSLHEMPEGERPRERLMTHGAAALSNAELLAILLRTGNREENVLRLAERLLAHYGGLAGLAQASLAELSHVHKLGQAKTSQIAAALELGRRLLTLKPEERRPILTAGDAAQLVMDMSSLPQEHIRVILLDNSRRVIAISTVYIGTVNAAMLRVAEIYREAVTRNAPALILVHNHPSGDPSPSPEDVQLTRTLIEAGKLLDIVLLDHLIIAGAQWRSLREMQLGFS
ncbi:MAG: DNA repair protein RadC [bacterium]|nr:DNA repair protein RadC [bacterium]